jgi:ATP-binding cassette, subfamily B, bacterial HlyB/CyaB
MAVKDLRDLLVKSPLFTIMEEELWGQVAEKFEIVSFDMGQTVFKEGESGDSFYVIYSGKARVVGSASDGSQITLTTLSKGDFFGEKALLQTEKRTATIRAASELVCAKLLKTDFLAIVETDEKIQKYLNDFLSHTAVRDFLRRFSVFSALTAKEITVWLDHLDHEKIKAGEFVFHEGDKPDKFYIILSGKVDIIQNIDGSDTVLRTQKKGEFFGEIALLSKKERSASVKVMEDLHVVTLKKGKFEELVTKSDKLRDKIYNIIAIYNLDTIPGELEFKVKTQADIVQSPVEQVKTETVETKRTLPIQQPYKPKPKGFFKKNIRKLKYPWIEQYDETDCGAASLAMICKYYDKKVSVTRMRDMTNVSTEGATFMSLARAAESIGFNTRAIKGTWDTLPRTPLPAIIHWDGYHYIVLYEVQSDRVIVGDPGRGLLTIKKDEFIKRWTGYTLILEPSAAIGRVPEMKTTLSRFIGYLIPYRWLLLEILLCSFLISIFGLASPIFTQLIVDNVVVHQNVTLLNTVLAGMLVVTFFSMISGGLRTYLSEHLSMKLEMSMLSHFYRHVVSLPMKFFAMRKVGDILTRFEENDKIKELMTSSSISMFIDVLMVFVYLTVMFIYSVHLTLIVILFIPFFIALTLGFTPIFKRMSRQSFSKEAAKESFMVESMGGVSTIKSASAEIFNRWKWENLFAKALKVRFRFAMIDLSSDNAAEVLQTLSSVVLLYFGATTVIKGDMTIGQLMAFMALVGQVIEPINKLVGQWNEIQEALISVERLNDVFDVSPEEPIGDESLVQMPAISGSVKFENVSFAYSEADKMILKNITFEAHPGQTIAIVGRSGSGKTTLINLLMRFYPPQKGRILIDDIDIEGVAVSSLRRQMGMVLQDNLLFSGTIRDNIALGAPDKPFNNIIEAATMAAAHDFISDMPLGYKTDVGERGSALSGGQRQRIAIARALVNDPKILIFDEATSALDNESEKAIQKNLAGITHDRTTFIIAHRLSTVQGADMIIVLDQGVIVEKGTHRELLDRRGLYYYLTSMSIEMD